MENRGKIQHKIVDCRDERNNRKVTNCAEIKDLARRLQPGYLIEYKKFTPFHLPILTKGPYFGLESVG